jgi:hypothetical protein
MTAQGDKISDFRANFTLQQIGNATNNERAFQNSYVSYSIGNFTYINASRTTIANQSDGANNLIANITGNADLYKNANISAAKGMNIAIVLQKSGPVLILIEMQGENHALFPELLYATTDYLEYGGTKIHLSSKGPVIHS